MSLNVQEEAKPPICPNHNGGDIRAIFTNK